MEPKHLRIYSFRITKNFRAVFVYNNNQTIEVVDINNHYRWFFPIFQRSFSPISHRSALRARAGLTFNPDRSSSESQLHDSDQERLGWLILSSSYS